MDRTGPQRLESLERRLHAFEAWTERHRRVFWSLHSLWALATGVLVVVLAHESYGFVPWLFGMLAVTWVSTLFFVRLGHREPASPLGRLGGGFVSYLTRVMYQETLFFLLPFYAYSTVLDPHPSWNALFLLILIALAVLSCLDLIFDRWIRGSEVFGLCFFALVAFAALNLVLPVLFRLEIERATQIASALAAVSALPLSFWAGRRGLRTRLTGIGVAVVLALGIPWAAPVLVPAAPLRVREIQFARAVERDPLRARGELPESPVPSAELDGRLVAIVTVFAPTRLHADVRLVWSRDGVVLRESRTVRILGHRDGFRVWDAVTFGDGRVPEGLYAVEIFAEGRLLGREQLEVGAVHVAHRF